MWILGGYWVDTGGYCVDTGWTLCGYWVDTGCMHHKVPGPPPNNGGPPNNLEDLKNLYGIKSHNAED